MSVDVEELRRLRRACDRMDHEYALPLDVPALASTAFMSPGHLSRAFARRISRRRTPTS